jgi:hypothetical protein
MRLVGERAGVLKGRHNLVDHPLAILTGHRLAAFEDQIVEAATGDDGDKFGAPSAIKFTGNREVSNLSKVKRLSLLGFQTPGVTCG